MSRTLRYRAGMILVGVIVTVLIVRAAFPSLGLSAQGDGATGIDYRDPAALRRIIEESPGEYLLLDVRTEGEFAAGRIPTAVNLPVQVIERRPPAVDPDTLIILYCATGNRSGSARRILARLGFTRVVDFGGINRWPYEIER